VTSDTTIRLVKGKGHNCADGEGCLFEWFNWITTGKSTDDRPLDVSPVLHQFGMHLNDLLPDDKRQELVRFLPNGTSPLAGTYGDGRDSVRGYMALDWLIRTYAPAWLDLAGLTAHAATLRDLDRLDGPESAGRARAAADAAGAAGRDAGRDAGRARAAADAAQAAAWAAARAAARAAADAAGAAAGAAGRAWAAADAARAAALAAARAAAQAAARDALGPTVAHLQDSAISLYDAMITGEWQS
jgi:regulator of protease activity HflC (stomatin/prohibitin superfamily)